MQTTASRTGSPVASWAFAAFVAALVAAAPPAAAQDEGEATDPSLERIEVIGITPMPGTGVARDRVPTSVQTLEAGDFDILAPRNLTDLMEQLLAGVSVKDVQNSPYQQNIDYRGYTLSPLLGEAQGIAVFLDGVRINEGFGDTMQWDLVPEAAIDRVDLAGGNPVFGLNALGGSLAITTKNGRTWQGNEAEAIFGSHGRIGAAFEAGGARDDTGYYVALEASEDDGWRDFSPSEIRRLFGNVNHRLDRGEVGLALLHADTEITGNGPTPEDLLGVRRESVFTWPDITDNRLTMGTVSGRFDVRDGLSIGAVAYTRELRRDTINGDEFDGEFGEADEFEEELDELKFPSTMDRDNIKGALKKLGSEDPGYLIVGDDDGLAVLFNAQGQPIRHATSAGVTVGARNLTFTDTDSLGFSLQADFERDRHMLAVGLAHDRSETTYRGHTLVGDLDETTRGVPPLVLSNGGTVTVGEQCEFELEANDNDEISTASGTAFINQINNFVDNGQCGELEDSDAAPLNVTAASESWGLYISDTFSLSERVDLTFAARYNRTEVELDLHDGDGEQRHPYGRFNPAIGAVARVSPRLALYGGYREANRAPTPAELSCADPEKPCRLPNAFLADPPLEQVVARTLEFGLRGDRGMPDDRLAWDIGFYGSENKDDLIFVARPGDLPGLGYFRNFGKTRRLGIDAALAGRRGRLDWFANYSFLRATYETGGELPGANHPVTKGEAIKVTSGDRIPGLPDHALKLGIGFRPDERFHVGLNSVTRSGVYLRGDESNQDAKTGGYTVLNLTGEYRAGAFTFFGRIENLLDTEYETFGIFGECEREEGDDDCEGEVTITGHGLEGGVHHTNRFLSPGAPRGIFVGARVRF